MIKILYNKGLMKTKTKHCLTQYQILSSYLLQPNVKPTQSGCLNWTEATDQTNQGNFIAIQSQDVSLITPFDWSSRPSSDCVHYINVIWPKVHVHSS